MRNNMALKRFFLVPACLYLSLYATSAEQRNRHARTDKIPRATVTTLRGRTFTMRALSSAHASDALTVFTAPSNTKKIVSLLDYNPRPTARNLALADIAQINIPYPYAVWYYNRNTGLRKHDKYLLIEVTLRSDPQAAPVNYLVRHKVRIHGIRGTSGTENAGSIALRAIKKIVFEHNIDMTETNL